MVPFDLLSFNPLGRLPATTDQVYGGLPLVAVNVAEYLTLWVFE